jgi:hypothetical protein
MLVHWRPPGLVSAKHAPICRWGQAHPGAKGMRQVALIDETDLLSNLGSCAGRPTQKLGRPISSTPSQQFSGRTAPYSSEHSSQGVPGERRSRQPVANAKARGRGAIHDYFVRARCPGGGSGGEQGRRVRLAQQLPAARLQDPRVASRTHFARDLKRRFQGRSCLRIFRDSSVSITHRGQVTGVDMLCMVTGFRLCTRGLAPAHISVTMRVTPDDHRTTPMCDYPRDSTLSVAHLHRDVPKMLADGAAVVRKGTRRVLIDLLAVDLLAVLISRRCGVSAHSTGNLYTEILLVTSSTAA